LEEGIATFSLDIISVIRDTGTTGTSVVDWAHLVYTCLYLRGIRSTIIYEHDEFSKKNIKSSSGSNYVLLEVSLSKYGMDSKNRTTIEIIN